MTRRTSLLLRLGFAALLALGAVGVITGPAFAHVTAVTINPDGDVIQPGGATVTVSGTLTCTHGSGSISVTVAQDQGQQLATAFASIAYTCSTAQPQGWIVTGLSALGFHGGQANVLVTVFNFGPDGFNFIQTADTVHLHPTH